MYIYFFSGKNKQPQGEKKIQFQPEKIGNYIS